MNRRLDDRSQWFALAGIWATDVMTACAVLATEGNASSSSVIHTITGFGAFGFVCSLAFPRFRRSATEYLAQLWVIFSVKLPYRAPQWALVMIPAISVVLAYIRLFPRYAAPELLTWLCLLTAVKLRQVVRRNLQYVRWPESFVERPQLQASLETLLADPEAAAIQVYGQAGVGKSELVAWIAATLPAEDTVIGSMRGLDYAGMLIGMGYVPPDAAEEANHALLRRILQNKRGSLYLVIDDYPEDDSANNITTWLLGEAGRLGVTLKLILVSRAPHALGTDTGALYIPPFTTSETSSFISLILLRNSACSALSVLYRNRIFYATKGNGKLITLLLANPELWDRFLLEPQSQVETYLPSAMNEILSHLEQSSRDGLDFIVCLAEYRRFLREAWLMALIADCSRVLPQLVGRRILDIHADGSYTVHDVIRERLYHHSLSYTTKVQRHAELAQYFYNSATAPERLTSLEADELFHLALEHAVASHKRITIKEVGRLGFMRLRWRARFNALASIVTVAERLFDGSDDSFRVRIAVEQAWCAMMLGNYTEFGRRASDAARQAAALHQEIDQAEGLWLEAESLRSQGYYQAALVKCDASKALFAELKATPDQYSLESIWVWWTRARTLTALGRLQEALVELDGWEWKWTGIPVAHLHSSFAAAEGIVYWSMGNGRTAKERYSLALEVTVEADDYWEAESRYLLAEAETICGDLITAERLASEAAELYGRLHNWTRQAGVRAFEAEICLHSANPSRAKALAESVLPTLRADGLVRELAFAKLVIIASSLALASTDLTSDRAQDSPLLKELEEVLKLTCRGNDLDALPNMRALRLRAEVLRLTGELAESRKLYWTIIQYCDRTGFALEAGHARIGWALSFGVDSIPARRRFREAGVVYRRVGYPWGQAVCDVLLGDHSVDGMQLPPLMNQWLDRRDRTGIWTIPVIMP